MRGMSGPFWQTNATVAAVSGTSLLLDGLDRQVPAVISELKPAGVGWSTLDWGGAASALRPWSAAVSS